MGRKVAGLIKDARVAEIPLAGHQVRPAEEQPLSAAC